VGPTYQLGAERGKGSSVQGRFPAVVVETGRASVEHTGLLGRTRKAVAREGVGRRGSLG
jgi:hypothetical protein